MYYDNLHRILPEQTPAVTAPNPSSAQIVLLADRRAAKRKAEKPSWIMVNGPTWGFLLAVIGAMALLPVLLVLHAPAEKHAVQASPDQASPDQASSGQAPPLRAALSR